MLVGDGRHFRSPLLVDAGDSVRDARGLAAGRALERQVQGERGAARHGLDRVGADAHPHLLARGQRRREAQPVEAYKYPRNVWFVDALPKGPTGKILKREIRRP
jgi:acyl-CoA synthetase (AMP-forming)/AMP-acid ligase II